MRPLKSAATVLAMVLVLAAVILGPMTLWSHVRATQDVVRDQLEKMSPDLQEAARIRVLLRGMDQRILDYHGRLEDVADRKEAAEAAANRIDGELTQQKDVLARARAMLDDSQSSYEIGGRSYGRDQLQADVKARLKHCEQLIEQLSFHSRVAAQLGAAEAEGRENLRKAQQVRQEREAELKELEVRLANAGLLRQVNELTGQLDQTPLGPETQLGKALAQLRSRVRAAEQQADYLTAETRGGMVIDWTGPDEHEPDLRAAIDQLLGK